jgi:NTE family protein
VLRSVGVPIDFLAGTSVGSAVAAAFSIGKSPDEIASLLDEAGTKLWRPTVPTHSFLSSRALRAAIRSLIGDRVIEEMPIPFAAVAADILSGREVHFREGPLWLALLASMSIPGVYPPVPIGAELLVDGGVVNPVPASVLSSMGSDVTIGVKLIGTTPIDMHGRTPSLLQALLRSMDLMMDKIDHVSASEATVLIAPKFSETTSLTLRNFRQGRRYIDAGEAAARAALPRLAATLPWLDSATAEDTGAGDRRAAAS